MVVLGSTGSIGVNALNIAREFNLGVEALSCNKNIALLNEQIAEFKPKFVCVRSESLRGGIIGLKSSQIFSGEDGILEMLEACESDNVVNSLVGFAGLKPSVKTQELGKTLCLANKESLVVGGKFLDTKSVRAIDSEHFGLKFLLKNKPSIKRLIITASGGAFRDTPVENLKNATPKDALKHPNWSMGAKITIDSATMANKLFEVMEAFWLYGVKAVDAVIERTSVIHALIDFVDGSTTAHLSKTDMRLAIAHAILPNLDSQILEHFDLLNLAPLKFEEICLEKYPVFRLKDAVLDNPDLGVIINAANEEYVAKFLAEKCGFMDIEKFVFESLAKFSDKKASNLDEIFETDRVVREFAKGL